VKRRAFTASLGGPLVELIAGEQQTSLGEASELVARGAVYVDGRRAQRDRPVVAGARVMIVLEEAGRPVTAPVALEKLIVLYEDAEVLAVLKPPFVVAQPTPGRVGDSLLDLASAYLGRPAGLVHRLDRETSGVTVFGKDSLSTSRLAAAFREGRAKKEYLAVTTGGLPERGVIELPLSRDPSRPGRWRATRSANGVAALTRYERQSDGRVSVVALFPETGRTHQLRAHLSGIGHPIVGDRLYGGSDGPRCLLHARRLCIDELELEAPVPEDFEPYLAQGS
jgi:23S rRNA pseudouridine1911/1915/1917 synthase